MSLLAGRRLGSDALSEDRAVESDDSSVRPAPAEDDGDLETGGRLSARDLPVLGRSLRSSLPGASETAYLRVLSIPSRELLESSSRASSTCATLALLLELFDMVGCAPAQSRPVTCW